MNISDRHRLFVCTDFLMAGGIEYQTTELIKRLNGYECHVLCLYASRWGRSVHFANQLPHVQVLDLGHGPLSKIQAIWAIIRAAWQLQPRLVYAVNYHSNLLTRLARPFLPRQTRLIGSVRNEYTAKQLRYERWSHRLCDAVICNSPHIQTMLEAVMPHDKIHFIPNGVDMERFARPVEAEWRQPLSSQRVLVNMGRIARQKNQTLLATAMGRLQQQGRLTMQVVMVGEVEDTAMQAELDHLRTLYNLTDWLLQVAPTPTPEVYYQGADATILSSDYEGLPNVALESLAAGKPVIISDRANASGLIEDRVTGWVFRAGDAASLAETLAYVSTLSAEALGAMQAACQQRAAEYAMPLMVARFENLYRSL
ncbi:MAG: glycosyltransferase family 4 protein [Anaerolineales bacterium]|nr:glycosyltransferase family 4 protein [Anaerolineales bacterium]